MPPPKKKKQQQNDVSASDKSDKKVKGNAKQKPKAKNKDKNENQQKDGLLDKLIENIKPEDFKQENQGEKPPEIKEEEEPIQQKSGGSPKEATKTEEPTEAEEKQEPKSVANNNSAHKSNHDSNASNKTNKSKLDTSQTLLEKRKKALGDRNSKANFSKLHFNQSKEQQFNQNVNKSSHQNLEGSVHNLSIMNKQLKKASKDSLGSQNSDLSKKSSLKPDKNDGQIVIKEREYKEMKQLAEHLGIDLDVEFEEHALLLRDFINQELPDQFVKEYDPQMNIVYYNKTDNQCYKVHPQMKKFRQVFFQQLEKKQQQVMQDQIGSKIKLQSSQPRRKLEVVKSKAIIKLGNQNSNRPQKSMYL